MMNQKQGGPEGETPGPERLVAASAMAADAERLRLLRRPVATGDKAAAPQQTAEGHAVHWQQRR
jgi:hypothetical protein